MAETSSRRDFLRLLVGKTARRAHDLAPLPLSVGQPREVSPSAIAAAPPTRTPPAELPGRTVAIDDMLRIADQLGLGRRSQALLQLARTSIRFGPARPGTQLRSFADGTSGALISLNCEELGFVEAGLPAAGRLLVFGPREMDSWDPRPNDGPIASVKFEPDGGEEVAPEGATPLAIGRELVLPRPWSTAVERLALSDSERRGWQTLRAHLAELQEVAHTDGAETSAPIHRVYGYPDERRGDMPLACELRARGFGLAGEPPRSNQAAAALEDESGHWQLLLQLSSDSDLGWSWGAGGTRRFYLWSRADDLRASRFDSVEPFVQ